MNILNIRTILILISLVFFAAPSVAKAQRTSFRNVNFKKNPWDLVLKKWNDRQDIISIGADKIGEESLNSIYSIMKESGIKNAPQISVSLLKEALTGKLDLSKDERKTLLKLAVAMSPTIPSLRLKAASIYLLELFEIKNGVQELMAYWDLAFKDYDSSIRIYSNLIFYLLLSFIITFTLFITILCLKYFPLLLHLFRHVLPPSISKLSICITLLMIPLFLFMFFGPAALLWALVPYLWLFSNWKERTVFVISLVFIVCLPAIFLLPSFAVKYQNSPERRILLSNNNPNHLENIEEMQDILKDNPTDLEAKFLLSLFYKRNGNPKMSLKILNEIIEKRPNWDKPHVNKGNLEFASGDIKGAIASYKKASSLNKSCFLAKYNLGKALYSEAEIEEANQNLNNATAIDPVRFKYYEEISDSQNFTLYIFDEDLNRKDLSSRIAVLKKTDKNVMKEIFYNLKITNLNAAESSLAFAILIAFLILLSKLSIRIIPPRACKICGASFCSRCSKVSDYRDICSPCYHIFIVKESIDPNFRATKESDEKKNKFLTAILKTWSSLIIPGFGHIYVGASLVGFIVMFLITFTLLKLFFVQGFIQDPYAISLKTASLSNYFLIPSAILIYIAANLTLRKVR